MIGRRGFGLQEGTGRGRAYRYLGLGEFRELFGMSIVCSPAFGHDDHALEGLGYLHTQYEYIITRVPTGTRGN